MMSPPQVSLVSPGNQRVLRRTAGNDDLPAGLASGLTGPRL